jgi:hypothetical protein
MRTALLHLEFERLGLCLSAVRVVGVYCILTLSAPVAFSLFAAAPSLIRESSYNQNPFI